MKVCRGHVSDDLAGMLMTEALSVFFLVFHALTHKFNCEMAMMECEMMLLKLTQISLCFEMFACVVAEGFQETYLQTVTIFTADQLSAKHSTKTLQTLQITINCTKFE